jgi:hypothetical protein
VPRGLAETEDISEVLTSSIIKANCMRLHGVKFQKIVVFILAAVKT